MDITITQPKLFKLSQQSCLNPSLGRDPSVHQEAAGSYYYGEFNKSVSMFLRILGEIRKAQKHRGKYAKETTQ